MPLMNVPDTKSTKGTVLCWGFSEQETLLESNLLLNGFHVLHTEQPQSEMLSSAALMIIIVDDQEDLVQQWLQQHRHTTSVPLVFLASTPSQALEIVFFKLGADDIIPRETSAYLLTMKLALIAQNPIESDSHYWGLENHRLELDVEGRLARLDGKNIDFTEREWSILSFLTTDSEKVRSRDDILEFCMGYDYEGYDRLVDTYVKNLRKKLGGAGWIRTQRGYGYRFMGQRIA
ncbi:MAG: response regulator transcription factor [Spirochaetales bacterium]|nr:response regulator transcription factor [Spirochaetales bacterium]